MTSDQAAALLQYWADMVNRTDAIGMMLAVLCTFAFLGCCLLASLLIIVIAEGR